jgi:hypothetical protein
MLDQKFFTLRWKDLEAEDLRGIRFRWVSPGCFPTNGVLRKITIDRTKRELKIEWMKGESTKNTDTFSLNQLAFPQVLSSGMILIRFIAIGFDCKTDFIQILSDTDNPVVRVLFPPQMPLEFFLGSKLKPVEIATIPPDLLKEMES